MQASQWIERLLSSTRGQIISLLRRAPAAVGELAGALGLTDNAVRAHLAAMERDGLVEQRRGPVRGVGKPAQLYALTPAADALLPKAYAPVLGVLLQTLGERMGPDELAGLLREVGRRAGAGRGREGADVRMRIEAAYGVLGEMGGVAEIEEADGAVTIRGFSCPLAALVPGHPQVCQLAEAMLTEIVGVPVREQCDKGERPRCCFHIPLPASAS
ncbi:helix-turn-helix transcriptional regulator [Longimicrobium sp.]|uniref:helix-turn-helix transcriptional regulator n=1 Tax=Longimicrobium sp. TaxID=2029185 RepID=UPI002E345304|nr:ArsR family transcriptional regulator [Longimicrobium sp.]HEX6038660.1 ArsR family transcriptional regulator [Longimicrobium sp.]